MLEKAWKCTRKAVINVDDSQTVEILKLIDSHLSEAVEADGDWADNLAPYDEDDTGVQTYYKMLQSLLLGPCEKLAKKRVEAIANGHNEIGRAHV